MRAAQDLAGILVVALGEKCHRFFDARRRRQQSVAFGIFAKAAQNLAIHLLRAELRSSPSSLSTALRIGLLTAIGCAMCFILSPGESGVIAILLSMLQSPRELEEVILGFFHSHMLQLPRAGARLSESETLPYIDSPWSAPDSQTADQIQVHMIEAIQHICLYHFIEGGKIDDHACFGSTGPPTSTSMM